MVSAVLFLFIPVVAFHLKDLSTYPSNNRDRLGPLSVRENRGGRPYLLLL